MQKNMQLLRIQIQIQIQILIFEVGWYAKNILLLQRQIQMKIQIFQVGWYAKKYAGSVAETNIAQEILHFAENKIWNKNNTTDWNWHKLWEKKQKKVLHHVFYVEEQPSFNWGTKVIENMTIIPILMMMMMMIIIMMVMMMIMMMTRIATKSAVHDRRTNSSWIDCLPDRCCCRCRKNLLIMSSPSLLFYPSPDF